MVFGALCLLLWSVLVHAWVSTFGGTSEDAPTALACHLESDTLIVAVHGRNATNFGLGSTLAANPAGASVEGYHAACNSCALQPCTAATRNPVPSPETEAWQRGAMDGIIMSMIFGVNAQSTLIASPPAPNDCKSSGGCSPFPPRMSPCPAVLYGVSSVHPPPALCPRLRCSLTALACIELCLIFRSGSAQMGDDPATSGAEWTGGTFTFPLDPTDSFLQYAFDSTGPVRLFCPITE